MITTRSLLALAVTAGWISLYLQRWRSFWLKRRSWLPSLVLIFRSLSDGRSLYPVLCALCTELLSARYEVFFTSAFLYLRLALRSLRLRLRRVGRDAWRLRARRTARVSLFTRFML